jgi:glycosyltransferase involved in cell wall biosynthesis
MTKSIMSNREHRDDFAVQWDWADGPSPDGITAVMRVKNEARSLPFVLPPVLRAVQRVLLVDNNSDDGTPELAKRIADQHAASDRLDVRSYPFSVSRCGPEHLGTPPDSVHSLAYFYNWSFSGVRTAYSLKWDGDMVLTEAGIIALRNLSWQLEHVEVVIVIPRHPLYVIDDSAAYFDLEFVNYEPFVFPNHPNYTFAKAFDWEVRLVPERTPWVNLQQGLQFELKWLDTDEFSNWSNREFKPEVRIRKSREWAIFEAHRHGDHPPGVLRVQADEGVHIVDYIREVWLPQQRRPIVDRGSSSSPASDAQAV